MVVVLIIELNYWHTICKTKGRAKTPSIISFTSSLKSSSSSIALAIAGLHYLWEELSGNRRRRFLDRLLSFAYFTSQGGCSAAGVEGIARIIMRVGYSISLTSVNVRFVWKPFVHRRRSRYHNNPSNLKKNGKIPPDCEYSLYHKFDHKRECNKT